MKRAILTMLSLILVLSLAACGGNGGSNSGGNDDPLNRSSGSDGNTGGTTSTPQGNNGDTPDLGAIIGDTGKLSDYDAATRQAMIDAAREDGGDLEFKADGSVVYTDPDGSVSIQNPDGTWEFTDPDGGQLQVGGNWPDNEFTKLLPKPDFEVSMAGTEEDTFTAVFGNVTAEQIRAYVENLKSAGFTVDAETEDQEVMGMAIYLYSAKNAAGYSVEVTSASGYAGMTIEKP